MKTNEIPANIGEYVKYDETSPTCLRWIKKTNTNISIVDEAGCKDSKHYYVITFCRKIYKNHRIVFFLHNGYCPDVIDHIDGNPLNNKIENLRECSLSENQHNRKLNKNNKCGHKGVYKSIQKYNSSGWIVKIRKNKKTYTKYFPIDQFQEACDYADELRNSLHGYFSNKGD